MDERLLHLDAEACARRGSGKRVGGQEPAVAHDRGTAIHPEGLPEAGDEEEEPGVPALHHVPERVDPPVARSIAEQETVLIEDCDETGRSATRGDVASALAIRRRHQNEGRVGDEVAAVVIEVTDRLAHDRLGRWPVKPREPLGGVDRLAEGPLWSVRHDSRLAVGSS